MPHLVRPLALYLFVELPPVAARFSLQMAALYSERENPNQHRKDVPKRAPLERPRRGIRGRFLSKKVEDVPLGKLGEEDSDLREVVGGRTEFAARTARAAKVASSTAKIVRLSMSIQPTVFRWKAATFDILAPASSESNLEHPRSPRARRLGLPPCRVPGSRVIDSG